jgi:hypothetical protein
MKEIHNQCLVQKNNELAEVKTEFRLIQREDLVKFKEDIENLHEA